MGPQPDESTGEAANLWASGKYSVISHGGAGQHVVPRLALKKISSKGCSHDPCPPDSLAPMDRINAARRAKYALRYRIACGGG